MAEVKTVFFDPSKDWVIARPALCADAGTALAKAIARLRHTPELPVQIDIADISPEDNIIIINCDELSRKTSFSWRASESRVEIYGHALSSVSAAVNDFLDALGFGKAGADALAPPAPGVNGLYKLSRTSACKMDEAGL